jgi:hypothetical protein
LAGRKLSPLFNGSSQWSIGETLKSFSWLMLPITRDNPSRAAVLVGEKIWKNMERRGQELRISFRCWNKSIGE